jgi:cysteine synthase A
VEPETAAYLSGRGVSNPNHKIQGGGYCMDLPLLEESLVEDYILISNEEAIETARRLAREEAIFGGFSSGANVAAALKLLEEREKGKNIAVLIPDSGFKYMSTDLFE